MPRGRPKKSRQPANFQKYSDEPDFYPSPALSPNLCPLESINALLPDPDIEIIQPGNAFNYYLDFDLLTMQDALEGDQRSSDADSSDSYDDDSDDEYEYSFVNQPEPAEPQITFRDANLRQINRDIREFVVNSIDPTLAFPAMDQCVRHQVQLIGEIYGLDYETKGPRRGRFLLFTRTSKTKKPHDHQLLNQLVNAPLQRSSKAPKGKVGSKKHERKHPKPAKERISNVPKEGSIVGQDAPTLDVDNVGNKLLRKFGWTPGQSLGTGNSGITEPVNAAYKKSKKGIGC